jgi:hypothetical protein
MARTLSTALLAAWSLTHLATAQTAPPPAPQAASTPAATGIRPAAPQAQLMGLRTMHAPPSAASGHAACTLLNSTREPVRVRRIEVRYTNVDSTPFDLGNDCPGILAGERLQPDRACTFSVYMLVPGTVTCVVQYESTNAGAVGSFSYTHTYTTGSPGNPLGGGVERSRMVLPLQHTP